MISSTTIWAIATSVFLVELVGSTVPIVGRLSLYTTPNDDCGLNIFPALKGEDFQED